MEKFLNLKDSDVEYTNPSEDALRRWRSAVIIVKNPRRRFRMVADLHKRNRMVADLHKRSEAEEEELVIQQPIRVQNAALGIEEKQKLEDVLSREYIVTMDDNAIRSQESVDDVGSTVKGLDVFQQLGKYEKRALAVFYIVLEAASFFLDLFGKNKWSILLAAFLLSVFGYSMTIYTCIMRRTRDATRVYCQKQLVRVVEIAFSVVQLVVTLIYFILAELGVKNNFSASVLPLIFAIIVAVFIFKYDEEVSDSSGHTDYNLSGDLPVTNTSLTEAIPSKSNELSPIRMTVKNLNSARDLNMTYSLASPVPPAADHQLNRQCQLLNTQVHMPNNMAAERANDLAMSTSNEDAEAYDNLSTLATVTPDG